MTLNAHHIATLSMQIQVDDDNYYIIFFISLFKRTTNNFYGLQIIVKQKNDPKKKIHARTRINNSHSS